MSDFPNPENYRKSVSDSHLRQLELLGMSSSFPMVLGKEKGVYLYDLDGNKYVDFFMNNGAAICGHNSGTLTQFVKNALSVGSESVFQNKFALRLMRQFRDALDFRFAMFFDSATDFLAGWTSQFSGLTVGVNTDYLYELLKPFEKSIRLEKIPSITGVYDCVVYEPIDFDGDLKDVHPGEFAAERKIAWESRTAFRLKYGFLSDLSQIDGIVVSDSVANGLSACAFFTDDETLRVAGKPIPAYKAVAMNEALKMYRRKIDYTEFKWKTEIPHCEAVRASIARVSIPDGAQTYSQGVFIKPPLLFLSTLHTQHDIRRLTKAIG